MTYSDTTYHSQIPVNYRATSSSVNLSLWVSEQRTLYKKKALPRNKIKLLEDAGLNLNARKKKAGNKGNKQWENSYKELVAYRYVNGIFIFCLAFVTH